jgi:MSHA biogenesis protein MshM
VKNTTPPEPFVYEDFQQALTALNKALIPGPAYALVLGDSGSGKTTLLRTLAAGVDRRRFHVLYLCHAQPSPCALTRVLAEALHLPLHRSRAETARLLAHTLRGLPTRLLLWIDEAQLVPEDTLHEIRLLAEADLDGPPLFSVLLSALPELKERLLAPQLFPLWRRIQPKLTLTGLRRAELEPFVHHAIGSHTAKRFDSHALDALFEHARGIPALIIDGLRESMKTYPQGMIGGPRIAEMLDQIDVS